MSDNSIIGRTPEEVRQIMEMLGIGKGEAFKKRSIWTPNLDNLVVEPSAGPSSTLNDKELYYFDKSVERLEEAGYDRHLRPNEIFSILTGYYNGSAKDPYRKIAEDITYGGGEWLSLAVQRSKNTLACYIDPQNIKWRQPRHYVEGQDVICSKKVEFDTSCLEEESTISLLDLDQRAPELLEFFCSANSYDDLPEKMREVMLYMPISDSITPVCFNNLAGTVHIQIADFSASRGARSKG